LHGKGKNSIRYQGNKTPDLFIKNMLQLLPIPTSILGLSDITIEQAEINNSGEFIITVKMVGLRV